MAYVQAAFTLDGTAVAAMVRGTPRQARIAPLPFVPHCYRRGNG